MSLHFPNGLSILLLDVNSLPDMTSYHNMDYCMNEKKNDV